MKKLIVGSLLLLGTLLFAGVSNISEYGKSSSGKTMYKVTCSNGSTYKIYKSGGEWYEASMGSIGGSYRSLNEQANQMCR